MEESKKWDREVPFYICWSEKSPRYDTILINPLNLKPKKCEEYFSYVTGIIPSWNTKYMTRSVHPLPLSYHSLL